MAILLKHEDGALMIPAEIFVAWGQPSSLAVVDDPDAVVVYIPERAGFRTRVAQTLLRRSPRTISLGATDPVAGFVSFADRDELIPDGAYLPGNYHPLYQLFEVAENKVKDGSIDKAEGNASTWAGIENYHEHLPLADQDDVAHAVSRLIVETVSDRFGEPSSILELGCGAGRNLYHLGHAFPNAVIKGIDINAGAAATHELPANVSVQRGNVLDLDWGLLGTVDVVLTAGFLMHINDHDVRPLVQRLHEASRFHLHWELHGPSYQWDYHRYPRSYRQLMDELGLDYDSYVIYPSDHVYSAGLSPSFAHAMLIGNVRDS